MLGSRNFLFAASISDLELKEPVTQKSQKMHTRSPNKCLLSFVNRLGTRQPSKQDHKLLNIYSIQSNTTEKHMTPSPHTNTIQDQVWNPNFDFIMLELTGQAPKPTSWCQRQSSREENFNSVSSEEYPPQSPETAEGMWLTCNSRKRKKKMSPI